MKPFRILLIDDDDLVCQVLDDQLVHAGYEVRKASCGESGLQLIQNDVFDAALLDIHLGDMTGIQILEELKRRDPEIDAVMMTGYPDVDTAVQALRLGAYDYLTKPVEWASLERLLQHVAERRYLRNEVRSLRKRLGERPDIGDFVGTSTSMTQLRDMIAKVASTDSPVLIEGESGTGKELVAYSVHRLSNRSRGPFVPVNCAAIPAELMESEIFGHVKGAFSGAASDSRGLFRSAEGGTLFLDEIGEMPLAMQPKLLRVLQEGEVRPVGTSQLHHVDVRVIAATNQDLDAAVRSGKFRQDLYFRLNVVRLEPPPLRSIKEDIPHIAMHCIRKLNHRLGRKVRTITPDALKALMAYDFPGNVRELENILERAYALGADGEIRVADLSNLTSRMSVGKSSDTCRSLDDLEREFVAETLRAHRNDKSKTAEALGMSERTLYRRLKKHRIGQSGPTSSPPQ